MPAWNQERAEDRDAEKSHSARRRGESEEKAHAPNLALQATHWIAQGVRLAAGRAQVAERLTALSAESANGTQQSDFWHELRYPRGAEPGLLYDFLMGRQGLFMTS